MVANPVSNLRDATVKARDMKNSLTSLEIPKLLLRTEMIKYIDTT